MGSQLAQVLQGFLKRCRLAQVLTQKGLHTLAALDGQVGQGIVARLVLTQPEQQFDLLMRAQQSPERGHVLHMFWRSHIAQDP